MQTQTVQHLSWPSFLEQLRWKQGNHTTIFGQTDSGKTHVLLKLLRDVVTPEHYGVFIATKKRDPILRKNALPGWEIIRKWPPTYDDPHQILWPKIERPEQIRDQQEQIARFLVDAYTRGGRVVAIDELNYVSDDLRLKPLLNMLYQQGRTLGVSMFACAQRPRNLVMGALGQIQHCIVLDVPDRYDLQRLSEIRDRNTFLAAVDECDFGSHDFVYASRRLVCVSRAPASLAA